jgi:hypothetical protein
MDATQRLPRLVLVLFVVGALPSCGGGGAGSAPTVAPIVTVPVLLSPADGATLDNGCVDHADPKTWDFDWSDVPDATSYHLYVKHPDPLVQFPAIDRSDLTSSMYRDQGRGYIPSLLLRGWEWRVRAEVRGVLQDWSRTGIFHVEPVDTDCS